MFSSLTQKLSPRAMWIVRLVLGILVLGILLVWQGDSILIPLRLAPWWTLVFSVVFYWILQALCAWKWRLLLNSALCKSTFDAKSTFTGQQLPFLTCARFYLAGMFWNLWMPTSIGGDAVRGYLAGKQSDRLGLAASSVFVDRLSGLVALLIIGAVAVVIDGLEKAGKTEIAALDSSEHLLWIAVALLAVLIIIAIASHFLTARLAQSEKAIIAKVARKWQKVHESVAVFLHPQARPALFVALLISLVFQAGLVILNIGLAQAVHLPLDSLTFWWLVPALSLAALLPVGIGGLGVREAAAVALAGPLVVAGGGEVSTLIAWSLLWQATLWLAGLPGAWSAGVTPQKVSNE